MRELVRVDHNNLGFTIDDFSSPLLVKTELKEKILANSNNSRKEVVSI